MQAREFQALMPGMRVRIVDRWNDNTNENKAGKMDQWLGQVMTIADRSTYSVKMEEDGGRWVWNRHTIRKLADPMPKYETLIRLIVENDTSFYDIGTDVASSLDTEDAEGVLIAMTGWDVFSILVLAGLAKDLEGVYEA